MKTYEFTIYVTASERGAMPGMVITYPMKTLHVEREHFTLEGVSKKVQQVRDTLITSRQFDSGHGFSIDARLTNGQRKPAGYDARRRERCTNYIAA